ncbi:hypothetical protein NP493_130g03000 [Ridgeia piscesae]|uniref:BHLH domain-containing protein n=1 Tax=Ridgeia piscesae TaxID=27915 RepID=A0AAD9UGF3_RIDPI|nr:hypothetical protein NP493_130g03000 [Ridgeia piscesae]
MSLYPRVTEKRKTMDGMPVLQKELGGAMTSMPSSPKGQLDQDKRMRREIANCNERRRMQSINSGFQSLKTLLPHHDSEKLSKAAILQQTSEYISSLEQEKKRLQLQNAKLKLMLQEMRQLDSDGSSEGSPPPKRKKRDTESSDEGISLSGGDSDEVDEMRREMVELRRQLEHERHLRVRLEEQTRQLETQLYPERHLRQIASHVEAQMRYHEEKQRYYDQHQHLQDRCRPDHLLTAKTPLPSHRSMPPSILSSSMSRRNLDTIVEAIRHLEGDQVLYGRESPANAAAQRIPHSEESEKESSCSDLDDSQSESSTHELPVSHMANHLKITSTLSLPPVKRYMASPVQLLHRPAVIVQNSS